ncbi:SpoIIIAH-like family protein [Cohnella boryungensis]|uniref:SpoIIIAH-like family protein n=1 Tax=Cohnella boryungensis TaxID=768479 RepID=A0ABV8S6U4_9BACL
MNNKRQTIWLVSMLSLMVILSAYYLFTEDAPSTNGVGGSEASQLIDNAGKVSASNEEGISVTEVDQMTDELTGVETGGKSGQQAAEGVQGTGGDASLSPEDQEVLKGIANAKGNELLDQLALEQQTKVSKHAEELSAIIGNTKVSQEEAASAAEELNRLEDIDSRITSLQEKLLQDFDNAVVSEVDTNFKVIVLSDKLEKKQAIGILDMATKELNVTPDRVTVQYVQ